MSIETLITLRMLGIRVFFASTWNILDFVVALLTIVSIAYGLEHLGRKGEVCEADVPILMIRFVLQPVRVLTSCAVARRTREMQGAVDDMDINFDRLCEMTETALPRSDSQS
eukprot:gnl/TRDRNA2_/TRDRNA2_83271_c0_seq2.p1 gnl/TRDRNA2_/TRDRNA2_83271_c0~~gnl/TRDRNA2_/TRDRNA2_83271_c0_seq2.p1  ORF type:complete len:112 (+),score=11.71 gnl/TRDRNA2_/TRDRNA2_83271_c0_seq2:68-403(+)